MHPLQIAALLHGHYRRLLRLDDPAVQTSEDAAAALGGRTNPRAAGFRLRQARALGSRRVCGAPSISSPRPTSTSKGRAPSREDVVVELLVARLAALTPGGRPKAC